MLDYIVLGQIPGTSLQLGFVGYLILSGLGLIIYDLKKFHPKQLYKLMVKLKIDKGLKKLQKSLKKQQKKLIRQLKKLNKKLEPYKKRLRKSFVHFRHDVLGPKLKFLK
jgi:hypothetical protein